MLNKLASLIEETIDSILFLNMSNLIVDINNLHILI